MHAYVGIYVEILREDRIWVRNQIKNNDEDILAIFK